MDALDNKCPACGAKITFNPVNQLWDCEYCGSKFTLQEIEQHNNTASSDSNVVQSVVSDETIGDIDVYKCKNCGAEIMADQNVVATSCAYCGSTAILKDRVSDEKAPNYVIPFKNVKEEAISAFKKVTKGKLLMPKCFKDPKNIENIVGIYIPFWAYDLEANGEVEFEAMDVKIWRDSNYRYTKTDRYSVRKSGHFDFNKVLADASSRFPDDLMDSLEPFDYNDLAEYNHAYLSGFLAEKYDISENVGLDRVTQRTNETAVNLIKTTVSHDHKKVINNGIRISSKRTHYIMLPVWMLNVKYKDKNYTFAMNGQTGKIVGNIPVGIKETIIWSIIIFVLLFALGFGFVWFV